MGRKRGLRKLSEAEQRWANEYPIYDDSTVADVKKKIDDAMVRYNGHPSKSVQSKRNKQALSTYIAAMRSRLNELIQEEKQAEYERIQSEAKAAAEAKAEANRKIEEEAKAAAEQKRKEAEQTSTPSTPSTPTQQTSTPSTPSTPTQTPQTEGGLVDEAKTAVSNIAGGKSKNKLIMYGLAGLGALLFIAVLIKRKKSV
jgi:hypothetical protein